VENVYPALGYDVLSHAWNGAVLALETLPREAR
jgi:hypothetical protein